MPAQASAPLQAPSVASPEAQETGAAPAKGKPVDAAGAEHASPQQKSWLVRHFSLLLRRDRQAQKAGQLFSGLLALNVVFLGGAFICSMIFNNVAVTLGDVWILLAALKALSLLWLLYFAARTTRHPHAVLYHDPHAGPIWVRAAPSASTSSGWAMTSATSTASRSWSSSSLSSRSSSSASRPGCSGNTVRTVFRSGPISPGNDTNTCLCLNATVCEVFQKGYLMLYPFSTEYCLLCCAVLFVMWKNVGRRLAPHTGTHPGTPPFHLHGAIFGPLLGLLALVAGVCIFVLFQIEASGPTIARQYFTLYYAFYVAVLPAMSLACLAGTAIHGLEERELDTLKNPTRSLDVVLLMGAALGQMGIAYFSIVAIVATSPHELLNRLILAYSLLLILQHIVQNLFIIEGLHRRPLWETAPEGPAGKREAEPPRRGSLLELGQDLRRASLAYIHSYSHLNWKRRALKEISLFLILCNITLWMMPAFGIHPEFENGLEQDFYGYQTWFTIVNFGLPLGVFYRMHSVGGLVEVYLEA
ncbi:proton channel OTOP3 isoform X3 [Ailuropoda melanoleuca]|uniref:proton channel OTOP3 isoform X3 n=1 Tax=Ailuropoda melanoleuca TaxID=9646 RepID=UPI0014945E48|nr:proton channel OTOP3 isoform X3 [Ailuropoda melanoleuca]